jgi:membrane-associated PAP2 superfamily phosphatase/diacylglycerol kinase
MLSNVAQARSCDAKRFLLWHALLIPAAFALAAWVAHGALDMRVSAAFYDPAAGTFPAHRWPLLEIVGHQLLKAAVVALWLVVLGAAVAAHWSPALRRHRALLWCTLAAMALGPAIVTALKDMNAYRCPWDLQSFGGVARFSSEWFVAPSHAGRCFPSGHAAGGFSLVALFFAGIATGQPRLRSAGLFVALAAGALFSAVRVVQGAHFLSHNLWSAAIDWCAAALVFGPLVGAAPPVDSGRDVTRSWRILTWARAHALRVVAATRWSLSGLRATWLGETAFRQELAAAVVLIPIALAADVSAAERALLIACLLLTLVVELLNTAIEAVVDLVSPERHPLAGAAKDAGSAAVFVSIAAACCTWAIVFWPAG